MKKLVTDTILIGFIAAGLLFAAYLMLSAMAEQQGRMSALYQDHYEVVNQCNQ